MTDQEIEYTVRISSNRQWDSLKECGIDDDWYQCNHDVIESACSVALELSRTGEVTCVTSGEDETIHFIYDNGVEYAPRT